MRRILYKIKQLHNNQTNIKSSLTGLHQSDFDNTCTQTEMKMEISNPKQSLILSMLPSLLSNGVPSFRFGFAFYLDFLSKLVTSIVMLTDFKPNPPSIVFSCTFIAKHLHLFAKKHLTIDFFSLENLHCDLVRQEHFWIEIRLLSRNISIQMRSGLFLFFKFLLIFCELINRVKKV